LVSTGVLLLLGVYLIILISRVYSLYRSIGFSKTTITPFLLMGVLFAFAGVTELLEVFEEDVGHTVHSLIMLSTAALLAYGLRGYHKMLTKAEEKKQLSTVKS